MDPDWAQPNALRPARPHAFAIVYRAASGVSCGGVLYQTRPMRRRRLPHGFTFFCETLRIPSSRAWLGEHAVEIIADNGYGASVGAYLAHNLTIHRRPNKVEHGR